MSLDQHSQAVLSPSGRYRAGACGNLIEIFDQEKDRSWIYYGHLEGIYQLQGAILSLYWESGQIICSESSTGATHRWLAVQAIHLSTPVVASCLRPQCKEISHGWLY